MLTKSEMDKKFAARVIKAGAPLTPAHAAAQAGLDADGDGDDGPDEAERRRERVQHLADPCPAGLPEMDRLDCAEIGKRFRQAFDTPDGYPPMRPVAAEQFRSSPGYGQPGQAVPVPSATLAPGMITRPLLADGQSRPNAPEAC